MIGVIIVMSFLPLSFGNDGASLDTNAAILLLHGRNPYTDSNILDAVRRFAIQPNWTTPLRVGHFANRLDYPSMADFRALFTHVQPNGQIPELESSVSYPALAFLTLLPFAFAKYYNIMPFFLFCYVLLVIVAWKKARPELRPWIILLGMANVPMWNLITGLNVDLLYILLISTAWLLRDQRWLSTLMLGLAIASKQTAWLFVPFYFIMVWQERSYKEAFARLVIAISIGLIINLPFIIWNASAWLHGILAPVADPMFPLGIGIISLSTTHLLPYFPNWIYGVLEAGTLASGFIWYWRHCKRYPQAAMLLAILPLFFAWRSLPSYFCCVPYTCFIILATLNNQYHHSPPSDAQN